MNDNVEAMDYYRKKYLDNKISCIECRSDNIKEMKTGHYVKKYYCKDCNKIFNEFAGTSFANKKIPIGKIFYIIENAHKKTIMQIAKDIGFS